MFFRISVAAELVPRSLPRRSNSIAIPRLSRLRRGLGIPSMLQAPLAKISIRSKTTRFIYTFAAKNRFLQGRGWILGRFSIPLQETAGLKPAELHYQVTRLVLEQEYL